MKRSMGSREGLRGAYRLCIALDVLLKQLQTIRHNINNKVNKCKTANTIGNTLVIIGGTLLFSSFTLFGICLCLAGTATSLGIYVAQYSMEKSTKIQLENVIKEAQKEQEKITNTLRTLGFSRARRVRVDAVKVKGFLSQAILNIFVKILSNLVLLSLYSIGPGMMKAASKIAMHIATFSSVLSTADIYMTWKFDSKIVKQIDEIIKLKSEEREGLLDTFNAIKTIKCKKNHRLGWVKRTNCRCYSCHQRVIYSYNCQWCDVDICLECVSLQ